MTPTSPEPPQYPGAVGLTWLRVYDSVAPDGVPGGSPHVHLASAEAYITVAGEGEVQTLGPDGLAIQRNAAFLIHVASGVFDNLAPDGDGTRGDQLL